MKTFRIADYERLVLELETGYAWTAYDYLNDIYCRVSLRYTPEEESRLAELDMRFLKATEASEQVCDQMPPGFPAALANRIPRNRTPEFDETL